MGKCCHLLVRNGNSRKKANKDLQDKQLLSFQSNKLRNSSALRSPEVCPFRLLWPLSAPCATWLTGQRSGALPKLLSRKTVTRPFRKLMVRSSQHPLPSGYCSVPSGQSLLARPFRARMSSSTLGTWESRTYFPGLDSWLCGQEWRSWRVTISRQPWAVPF